MKNTNTNSRILASTHKFDGSFDIYLDISGKKEFLFTHSHNSFLYAVLKDGISLEEWNRRTAWKPHSRVRNGREVRRLEGAARRLSTIIDDYLAQRDGYLFEQPTLPNPDPLLHKAA